MNRELREGEELLVVVEAEQDAPSRVLAPAVGWCSELPAGGAMLEAGGYAGRLRVLNRCFSLRLPEGAAGTVVETPAEKIVAVQYGQTLFRIEPFGAGRKSTAVRSGQAAPDSGSDLPAGTWALRAPCDGIFYRRPSPDSPPFVEPGGTVRAGQAVGLVEVMKTFNQILYGGPGLPPEAEVVEIRCEEAEEVRAGQVLLVVR
jgi:acetyl-CoA carboxylase biotin carboxyl carrier protein